MKLKEGGKLGIILISVLMLISYFPVTTAGVNYNSSSQVGGNLYIPSGSTFIINESTIDPLTGQSGQFGMSGSLFVNSSATLIIDNATLYFRQDVLHHYRMFVNGTLIMNNAVIRTSYNSIQPYLPLNISFYNANIETNGAHFLFPGTVYFYKSTMVLKNTYFNELPGIPPALNQGNVSDSSPTPSFYYSTGYFDNVFFKNMFNPLPIGNVFIANSTASKLPINITAGISYTEYSILKNVNFTGQTLISGINLDINYTSNSNASITLYANGKSLSLSNSTLPSSSGKKVFLNISTSPQIIPLRLSQLYNDKLYLVIKDTSKSGYFNVSKLNFLLSTNDTFDYYGGNSSFYFNMYDSSIYGTNVFIDSNFANDTLYNGLERNIKNLITLEDNSDLSVANLTVAGSINGTDQMTDNPPFLVDSSSQVNIFRYAEINVENYQGYPISGLKINAQENWPDNYPNAQQYTSIASSLNTNLQNILVNQGFMPSNFEYTSYGKAFIPLLSDIFTNSTSPNTLIMGHYELVFPNGQTANITLDSFPSMTSESNYAKLNVTFDSPFLYFNINSLPEFIYGNTENIGITVTSFGGPISGSFILLNNTTQLTSYFVDLKSNSTTNIIIPYVDNLSPGKHNLTLEFASSQVYASPAPLNFNITSYSNVKLVVSATVTPKYELNNYIVSGYKSNLTVQIKNLGNQSSGEVKINTTYKLPSGYAYTFNLIGVINAKSEITLSYSIPAFNVSSSSILNIRVSANTSGGVIPYSTQYQNFISNFSVLPKPSINIISASFNNTYLFGLNASGVITMESNEALSNVTLNLQLNSKVVSYKIPEINGYLSYPVSLPYNLLNLGINNLTLEINNTGEPFLNVSTPLQYSFIVEKNYKFLIENTVFVLSSNISSYVEGSLFFTVENSGNFTTTSVPVQVLYNGIGIFSGNESVNTPIQVPVNVSYSSAMNFEIIANYNFQYPSSYTFYPYMYYNSTLNIPYFYYSYSTPSQIINGSFINGYFSINDITNYYSNDTKLLYYVGGHLAIQKYLGNLSAGYSNTIKFNVSTSSIPDIMNGNNMEQYETYILIKDSETSYFGIKINLGTITILERPDFILSNISILANNHNTSVIYAGEPFVVKFMVINNGGMPSSGPIPYKIVGVNNTTSVLLYSGYFNQTIYAGQSVQITTNSIPTKSTFSGLLFIYFNFNNTINTEIPGALNYSVTFSIINPKLTFIITPFYPNIKSGSTETIQIKAINLNTSQPWQTNITVTVFQGSKLVERIDGRTNSQGLFIFSFKALNSGNYNIVVTYKGPTSYLTQSYSNVFTVKQAPFVIPSFVFPVVIIVIVIIALIFLINYFRNKSTGLVQCSVCGAILPEGTTKCPRCGTEFEKERVKCSECGSWIPEDSKYCPNCGAIFIGKQDNNYSGLSKLKGEYELFLDSYRQKARAIFGDKMNEMEFQGWWRNSPEYKSFKQWITEKGIAPADLEKNEPNEAKTDLKVEKKKGLFRRNKK